MTEQEAVNYAKSVNFCAGCPEDFSQMGEIPCIDCEHRKFFVMAISALEKQTPMKPIHYNSVPHERCPKCHKAIRVYEYDTKEFNCCYWCGQRLMWEDEE